SGDREAELGISGRVRQLRVAGLEGAIGRATPDVAHRDRRHRETPTERVPDVHVAEELRGNLEGLTDPAGVPPRIGRRGIRAVTHVSVTEDARETPVPAVVFDARDVAVLGLPEGDERHDAAPLQVRD